MIITKRDEIKFSNAMFSILNQFDG